VGSNKTYSVSVSGATVPAGHSLPASQRAKKTTHVPTTTTSLADRKTSKVC